MSHKLLCSCIWLLNLAPKWFALWGCHSLTRAMAWRGRSGETRPQTHARPSTCARGDLCLVVTGDVTKIARPRIVGAVSKIARPRHVHDIIFDMVPSCGECLARSCACAQQIVSARAGEGASCLLLSRSVRTAKARVACFGGPGYWACRPFSLARSRTTDTQQIHHNKQIHNITIDMNTSTVCAHMCA